MTIRLKSLPAGFALPPQKPGTASKLRQRPKSPAKAPEPLERNIQRAIIAYLESLGTGPSRRARLVDAMNAIRAYETTLAAKLLAGLAARPAWRVWGHSRAEDLPRRTPTFAVTHATRSPLEVAEHLARHEIYAWSGNFYAMELAERLGVEDHGGFLRLGLVHYNTAREVERTLSALDEMR